MFTAPVHTRVVQLTQNEEEQSGTGTRRPSWDTMKAVPQPDMATTCPVETQMSWNVDTI
jgi:hypothetical protein